MNEDNLILMSTNLSPPEYTGSGLRALRMMNRLRGYQNYKIQMFSGYMNPKLNRSKEANIKKVRIFRSKYLFLFEAIHVFIQSTIFLMKNKQLRILHFFSFTWFNRFLMLSNILFFRKRTILEVTLDAEDDPISLLNRGIKNRILRNFTSKLLKKIDYFIVQTEYSYKSCLEFGIPKNSIWKRPNPIDTDLFGSIPLTDNHMLRKKLNLPNNKKIMINVAIIQPRKNQLFLCKCINEMKDKDVLLLLIGPQDQANSDYYAKIMSYIKQNNLHEQIWLIGLKSNINEYMVASDLFLFASINEGFGNVIGESLTSGTPVLTFELSGLKGYINKGNGMIVKNAGDEKVNINRFTSALNSMINRKYNKTKIRKNALFHFGNKQIDKDYLKIYGRLVKK